MQAGGQTYIYHEKQDAGLCAVHCLNSLLQGRYFSEIDLAEIAREFDEKEREVMAESGIESTDFLKFLGEDSGNLADDGNYSVQVVATALAVWNLELVPISKVPKAKQNPLEETAFVCNLANHWLTVRKIGEHWYNLNSLYDAPQYLSPFYLSAFLDTLMHRGYSIFVVVGELPKVVYDPLSLCLYLTSSFESKIETADSAWKKAPKPPKSTATSQNTATTATEEDAALQAALEASELEAAIAASLSSQTTPQPSASAPPEPVSPSAPTLPETLSEEDAELMEAIKLSQQLPSRNQENTENK